MSVPGCCGSAALGWAGSGEKMGQRRTEWETGGEDTASFPDRPRPGILSKPWTTGLEAGCHFLFTRILPSDSPNGSWGMEKLGGKTCPSEGKAPVAPCPISPPSPGLMGAAPARPLPFGHELPLCCLLSPSLGLALNGGQELTLGQAELIQEELGRRFAGMATGHTCLESTG